MACRNIFRELDLHFRTKRYLGYASLILVVWITLSAISGPSSTDIRLDTGDLRYRFCGIPITVSTMPEPQRTRLLDLAKQSDVIDSSWHQCADYPLPTTNNTDSMCRWFYLNLAAWIDEDPDLAILLMEDVASYIRKTNARHGGPENPYLLLRCVERKDDGSRVVKEGWREDDQVQMELEALGYSAEPDIQIQ